MRIGYLECFSGISGDMLLGALVDAGVPFALLEETTAALNIGARLEMRKASRGGLAGTKIDVVIENDDAAVDHAHGETEHAHSHSHHETAHAHEHGSTHSHEHRHADGTVHAHDHQHEHGHEHTHQPHRSLSTILEIIDHAPIADSVKAQASACVSTAR